MNYSKQRKLIEDYVKSVRCHPTAEDVYNALKPENPGLSLGTVYRNLKQLSENSIILKLGMPGASDRYDGVTDDHQHLFCVKCNEIFDVDLSICDEIKKKVHERTGFICSGCNIIIQGICKNCAKL